MPFYLLERLEGSLGIPLPALTQWGMLDLFPGIHHASFE
jgi:hypothetical protein